MDTPASGEVRILATATVGLGFGYRAFQAGLELKPHMIGADSGSSDFGPYYLGTGDCWLPEVSVKRDLEILVEGSRRAGVPFITGSAGGAGTDTQVDSYVAIVKDIAQRKKLHFRIATIRAQLSKDLLKRKLREGKLRPLGDVESVTEATFDRMSAAVGMMGVEPFIDALDQGADVIIAGRSADPAIFAGIPLRMGIPPDIAWHAAKTADKGGLATTRSQDGSAILLQVHRDDFSVTPTAPQSACTVESVASLTLHENPDPYAVIQPTGTINTRTTVYEPLDQRSVRVCGSRYDASATPTIKVEGAELIGYRYILIVGLRDPRLLDRLDEFLDAYRNNINTAAKSLGIEPDAYKIQFRVYGRDAVMGDIEPFRDQIGHEIGLMVDVVGRTDEIARVIAGRIGTTGSRFDITGKLGGGGNFAYPFSPSVARVGPVYKWSIWHVMETDKEEMRHLFPISIQDV